PEIKSRIDEIAQFVPVVAENDVFSKARVKHLSSL
ncbi:K+ channel protein, partial [Globisporangium polare]